MGPMLNYITKLYQLGSLPVIRPCTTVRMAVGAGSVTSGALSATVVRLVATVDCHVAFGASPVADTNSLFLPASTPEYFACHSGEQVAVIRTSADGALFVTGAV